jgi:hypothetical protein
LVEEVEGAAGWLESDLALEATLALGKWLLLFGLLCETGVDAIVVAGLAAETILAGWAEEAEAVLSDLELETDAVWVDAGREAEGRGEAFAWGAGEEE